MSNTDSPSSVYLPGTRRKWVCCVLTGCCAIALLDVPPGTPGVPGRGWVVRLDAKRSKGIELKTGTKAEPKQK